VNAWPKPPELILRLALGFGLALWFAHRYGRELAEVLLPVIAATFSWLDDHYRLISLSIDTEGPDTVFRLRANLARPLVVGDQLFQPHPLGWAEVTTSIGIMLEPVIVLIGLLPVWPVRHGWEWLFRLMLGIPMAGLLILVNIPFTLWAFLWNLHVQSFDPEMFSPLLIWVRFLGDGGRALLGLLGAVSILWTVALLAKKRHRHQSTLTGA
jgi:hypothetical protein